MCTHPTDSLACGGHGATVLPHNFCKTTMEISSEQRVVSANKRTKDLKHTPECPNISDHSLSKLTFNGSHDPRYDAINRVQHSEHHALHSNYFKQFETAAMIRFTYVNSCALLSEALHGRTCSFQRSNSVHQRSETSISSPTRFKIRLFHHLIICSSVQSTSLQQKLQTLFQPVTSQASTSTPSINPSIDHLPSAKLAPVVLFSLHA